MSNRGNVYDNVTVGRKTGLERESGKMDSTRNVLHLFYGGKSGEMTTYLFLF